MTALAEYRAVPRALARQEAIRAAALDAEAERIRQIFNSVEGQANETLASHFAFESEMPAHAAIAEMKKLAAMPADEPINPLYGERK